jgi:Uma2 family endonuclease
MLEKKKLYFAKGAKEYWLCDEAGNVAFYNRTGEIDRSEYFPAMLNKISVDA